ncbi:MAG TPA: glutathione S-transferase family protein [Thermoleophilaceae bacterium]|jgi:glutathione S-transferase
MSLRLHDYAPSANCYKVRLLLAQLGREYERVPVDIFAGETLTPEFREKNPAMTTPVLEYEPGRYLPESAAILLYLADGTHLLPDDRAERAEVHRWLFFEQANVVPTVASVRFRLLTGRLDPESGSARRRAAFATGVVATVDAHLAGREFAAAGAYSVADIALYGYLHVAHEAGVDTAPFENVARWLDSVRAQPNHVADLEPYPENSRPGRSRSIYDAQS